MNDKKICFVACTNNELLMSECIEYINRLYVPEGYEIDILTVKDAICMTKGYNEAMNSTDARYKVYLHQDVFITNRYFIYDILNIFDSDDNIGLIGMVGYPKVSNNGVMWYERRVGAVPMYGAVEAFKNVSFADYRYDISEGFTDVAAADGLMLITSKDVEWDERFDGWDFYDATQTIRFRNAGYRAVVPVQRVPWFVHDDGYYLSVWNYNKYRHQFLEEYKELIEKVNCNKERKLDSKKIAFIICTNDEMYYEECYWYLSKLNIPGYAIEVLPIRGAKSIAEGYNLAMDNSDAKYKFYIHQDVFIVNENLIIEFIKKFNENDKIGMLGVLGTDRMKKDGFFWDSWNIGQTYVVTPTHIGDFYAKEHEQKYYTAMAIDGMLMATQYDIPWRTDIGLKWDYYDISQSLEFTKRGYEIGVICTDELLTIHDCGVTNIKNIEYSRKLFANEYRELGFEYEPDIKYEMVSGKSADVGEKLFAWFDNQEYEKIRELGDELGGKGGFVLSTNSRLLIQFVEIYYEEIKNKQTHSYIGNMVDFEKMKKDFVKASFLFRRLAYDKTSQSVEIVDKLLLERAYSEAALTAIKRRALFD